MASPTAGGFLRGAHPTPRHKLLRAKPFWPMGTPPPGVAYVPKQLSVWGNNQHGCCVSSEEAFAKACYLPEIFIPEQTVIDWARRHNVLEGADLMQVMEMMAHDGFKVGDQVYNDGSPLGVDYTKEMVLQGALAQGPVKIGIDANALPQGAGQQQGWVGKGGSRQYRNEDHCVSLAGYGEAGWLFQQLGVPLPSGLTGSGYLLFTWSTIGFVDHPWILSTVGEAWVRNPTTVGVPPLAPPAPVTVDFANL